MRSHVEKRDTDRGNSLWFIQVDSAAKFHERMPGAKRNVLTDRQFDFLFITKTFISLKKTKTFSENLKLSGIYFMKSTL